MKILAFITLIAIGASLNIDIAKIVKNLDIDLKIPELHLDSNN